MSGNTGERTGLWGAIVSPQVSKAMLARSPSMVPRGRARVMRAPESEMLEVCARMVSPLGRVNTAGTAASVRARTRICSRSRPTATAAEAGMTQSAAQMVFSR